MILNGIKVLVVVKMWPESWQNW